MPSASRETVKRLFGERALYLCLEGDRSKDDGSSDRLQKLGMEVGNKGITFVLVDLRPAEYDGASPELETRVRRVALRFNRTKFALLADNPEHPVAHLIARCLQDAGHETRRVADLAEAGAFFFPGEEFHLID